MTHHYNPMRILPFIVGAAAAVWAFSACSESSNIGQSIVQDEIQIVVDSVYSVTGYTVENERIQSRTVTQLLGSIDAAEYGSFTSDFVTQYLPSVALDTVGIGVEDIDSLEMVLTVPLGGYVGDSITPMGLTVYELTKQLPSPIYSDFDPQAEGCYDPSKPIATKVYACNAVGEPDSLKKLKYRTVSATLPRELGQRLYKAYLDNPTSYLEPSTFSKIFPGLYVANSYGTGRVIKIASNQLRMHYHKPDTTKTGADTIVSAYANYYTVSPEIITNNNINLAMAENLKHMAKAGDALLVAPAGMDVQMTFPLEEMLSRYRNNPNALTVINTLNFNVPVEEIANEYGIDPPQHLLMVLTSKRDEFFAKNQVTDNITSFYATYDAANKLYSFTGMRGYLLEMLDKAQITADDYTFTLTPVSVVVETTSTYNPTTFISAVVPYVDTPAMARLLLDKAKLKLTYSKQSMM
ncbi:MAG: DUF4270 domain-containing protein [Muribaculaceae bacterium]|nr:DUF4270 domain-containing protein [Muribaculaceae bacterium]MDE6321423.1 DUF4270 domain-containing protein [Muribaculaceae bacterium]